VQVRVRSRRERASGEIRLLDPGFEVEGAASWLPDGKAFLFKWKNKLLLADIDGQERRLLYGLGSDAGQGWGRGFSQTPDGRKLAFLDWRG
jgi:hypothetical protein